MAKLVLPRVQAMVVCDRVEESGEEYGIYHLHAVRSTLEAPAFPYTCPRLCAFLQMSGHPGEAICRVQILHAATDEVIYGTRPRTVIFTGPTHVAPMIFRLRNCSFP